MKKGISANVLKLIAIIAMLIDHIAFVFLPDTSIWYFVMRTVGRITAPVMCFFIAEGYYHTRNLKKYMLRLFIFAVISHNPYMLLFADSPTSPTTSIMLPLLLGLTALWLYDKKPLGTPWSYAFIVLCFLISIPCDWSCMPVFFILIFGIFRENKKELLIRYAIVAGVFAIVSVVNDINMFYMGGVFLAIPLIALYSGERGIKSGLIKWGFYVFYPAHLLILFLIAFALH